MAVNIEYEIIAKENNDIIDIEFLKNYLRVSHNYDDNLIKMLLDSAINVVEDFLHIHINPATIMATISGVSKSFYLPYGPISSIKSAILKLDGVKANIIDQLKFKTEQGKVLCCDESIIGKRIAILYVSGYEKQIPPSLYNGLLQLVRRQYESEANEQINPGIISDIFHSYRRLKI